MGLLEIERVERNIAGILEQGRQLPKSLERELIIQIADYQRHLNEIVIPRQQELEEEVETLREANEDLERQIEDASVTNDSLCLSILNRLETSMLSHEERGFLLELAQFAVSVDEQLEGHGGAGQYTQRLAVLKAIFSIPMQ